MYYLGPDRIRKLSFFELKIETHRLTNFYMNSIVKSRLILNHLDHMSMGSIYPIEHFHLNFLYLSMYNIRTFHLRNHNLPGVDMFSSTLIFHRLPFIIID